MIFRKIEEWIFTKPGKNQMEKFNKFQNLLNDMNQLFTIYTKNEYYLVKSNIYNLKINSSIDEGYNLKTIETVINTSLM